MRPIALVLALLLVLTGCTALNMSPAERGYQAILDQNWSSAESELRVAIRRDSDDAYSVLNLGWVMHKTGRYDEARSYYERVLEMDGATASRASERGSRGKSVQTLAHENIALLPS